MVSGGCCGGKNPEGTEAQEAGRSGSIWKHLEARTGHVITRNTNTVASEIVNSQLVRDRSPINGDQILASHRLAGDARRGKNSLFSEFGGIEAGLLEVPSFLIRSQILCSYMC